MREIHEHETNDCNKAIRITADEPDPNNGNASHEYEIARTEGQLHFATLSFQNGPIGEVGVNGITNEALLAIVADRLRCFQTSAYSCRENAIALTKIEEAAHWLEARTTARIRRGVEGTSKV